MLNSGSQIVDKALCNAGSVSMQKALPGYLYANIDLIGHHNHNDAIGRMTMNEQTISVAEAKGWLDNNS
jgi:hypothetical protein